MPGKLSEISINEQPIHKPRKLRVVSVGAGVSGLTLAHKLKYETSLSDFVDWQIYEKNADIGGTWYENQYPGLSCDIPAHIYTFQFEPNPDWSEFYASGPEIWQYMKRTTKKYNLDEHVSFNSKILESTWDKSAGKWNIKVQKGEEVILDQADILVNTTGFLNKWKWPQIEGLDEFSGKLMHSAAWDRNVDWHGKRVAVIGNGSSAIQIVPAMQKSASQLITYIRNPTWIISNFAAQFTKDGGNFQYTEEEKEAFRSDPEKLRKYRHDIEHDLNGYFMAFLKDSPAQNYLRGVFQKTMEAKLENAPELREKLIPNFEVGCRRPTPGDGYLEALQKDNVRVEFDGIDRITSKGIKTRNGNEEEFDIIVCATGFDVSFNPSWSIKGQGEETLAEQWGDDPQAYFGVCTPRMPNFFMFTGPNSPLGHGSLFSVLDTTAAFILKWVNRIATTGIKSVTVSEDATREYNEYCNALLERTVWSGACRSWYKNGKIDGKVTAMYCGSVLHFKEALESFRVEDFEIEYQSRNRFAFLGNGLTDVDVKGEDLAFYVKK